MSDKMVPELTTGPRRYSQDLRNALSMHDHIRPRPTKDDLVSIPVSVLATLVSWAGIGNPDESKRFKACLAGEAAIREWMKQKDDAASA